MTSNPKLLLETKELEIGYRHKRGNATIASDINLSVREGELIGVIGINGSGKSTLLKTLTQSLDSISGSINIREKTLSDFSRKKLSEEISLVLTDQYFSKNLSVLELIALGRQPYTNWLGVLSPEDKKKVSKALKMTEIESLSHKKCDELSDGQLQKVLIARALAQDTSLIFMDEPTTHLDMYHKVYVLQLLKQLTKDTKKSIVFATHEINLALQLCDRIIVVDSGKVIQGEPEELIAQKVFERLFPSELVQFDSETKSFKVKKE